MNKKIQTKTDLLPRAILWFLVGIVCTAFLLWSGVAKAAQNVVTR